MARFARPTSRTSLRYIAPDDQSIGFEPGTDDFKAAWDAYANSFDERHLKLKDGEAPSYYYFKVLALEDQIKFFDTMRAADEDDTSNTIERMFSPEMLATTRDFIDRNLVGCDDHQEVTEIRADGSLVVRSYKWSVGSPRPDGLLDSVLADRNLAFNLITFCFNANKLSEKEKKP